MGQIHSCDPILVNGEHWAMERRKGWKEAAGDVSGAVCCTLIPLWIWGWGWAAEFRRGPWSPNQSPWGAFSLSPRVWSYSLDRKDCFSRHQGIDRNSSTFCLNFTASFYPSERSLLIIRICFCFNCFSGSLFTQSGPCRAQEGPLPGPSPQKTLLIRAEPSAKEGRCALNLLPWVSSNSTASLQGTPPPSLPAELQQEAPIFFLPSQAQLSKVKQ